MQSSRPVGGQGCFARCRQNILTRRANHWHYCIIAQFAGLPPAPADKGAVRCDCGETIFQQLIVAPVRSRRMIACVLPNARAPNARAEELSTRTQFQAPTWQRHRDSRSGFELVFCTGALTVWQRCPVYSDSCRLASAPTSAALGTAADTVAMPNIPL